MRKTSKHGSAEGLMGLGKREGQVGLGASGAGGGLGIRGLMVGEKSWRVGGSGIASIEEIVKYNR
jgi:hypothetical protein